MGSLNGSQCRIAWIVVLLSLGGGVLCAIPWANVLRARAFVQTPCTIRSCEIGRVSSDGEGADSFEVRIAYAYQWQGRDFTGDRYDYQVGASSLTDAKREALERLKPGTKTVCWVNPGEPGEAVIDRGLTLIHMAIILPAGFLLLSMAALWFARRDEEL